MRNDILRQVVQRYREIVLAMGTEAVAQPATAAELAQVGAGATERLEATLDPAYLALASVADGIGMDGWRIYATARKRVTDPESESPRYLESLIEENLDWRADVMQKQQDWNKFLHYGIGELAFIVQHLPTRRFQVRSRTGWDLVIREFGSFEEVLWDVLRYPLDLGEYPAA
jgi:hypothetical protein